MNGVYSKETTNPSLPMKTLSLVSLIVLSTTVLSLSARGEEPPVSQTVKLTPQIQAMLAELLKAADADPAAEDSSTGNPATASATAAPAEKIKPPLSTALHTNSLRTGGLSTGSLGGHGTLDGAPRMTKEEWRQMFPVRP